MVPLRKVDKGSKARTLCVRSVYTHFFLAVGVNHRQSIHHVGTMSLCVHAVLLQSLRSKVLILPPQLFRDYKCWSGTWKSSQAAVHYLSVKLALCVCTRIILMLSLMLTGGLKLRTKAFKCVFSLKNDLFCSIKRLLTCVKHTGFVRLLYHLRYTKKYTAEAVRVKYILITICVYGVFHNNILERFVSWKASNVFQHYSWACGLEWRIYIHMCSTDLYYKIMYIL